jgi:hypothetical protein
VARYLTVRSFVPALSRHGSTPDGTSFPIERRLLF